MNKRIKKKIEKRKQALKREARKENMKKLLGPIKKHLAKVTRDVSIYAMVDSWITWSMYSYWSIAKNYKKGDI